MIVKYKVLDKDRIIQIDQEQNFNLWIVDTALQYAGQFIDVDIVQKDSVWLAGTTNYIDKQLLDPNFYPEFRVKSLEEIEDTLNGEGVSPAGVIFEDNMKKYCNKTGVLQLLVNSDNILALNLHDGSTEYKTEWLDEVWIEQVNKLDNKIKGFL